MRQNNYFSPSLRLVSILAIAVLFRCASPGSIQGGPKDEIPPSVDSTKSTPTPQINFNPREIVIAFDEWVKLDDPFSQIFISPPLDKRPEYKLKGKSLIISFDETEELQKNTTYILNLGTAVQDITESNPVEDYQFVFSTGDVLDSLGFGGVITDALTGEPIENVSVMLYKNLADSAISTLAPSYFARTGKDGRYRFDYLQADTFQLLGYVDDDLDFRYNEETEALGFLPKPIYTGGINDSTLSFNLSQGSPPVYLDDVDSAVTGLLQLIYSGPITDSANLKLDVSSVRHIDRNQDKIRIYYDPNNLPVHVISTNIKGERDTLDILNGEKAPLDPEDLQFVRQNATFLPGERLKIMSNWPIQSVDPGKMELIKQKGNKPLALDTVIVGFNSIDIKYPWVADSTYQLTLLPGAIRFENDIPHDTVVYKVQPIAPESLASLVITMTTDSGYILPPQFILKLKEKEKVIDQKLVLNIDEKVTFSSLKPGSYTLEVVWDKNKNGIWDPARYPGRRTAERIQKVEIENLRINWIQETEVLLKR